MGIFDRILSWVGFEVVDEEEEEQQAATTDPLESVAPALPEGNHRPRAGEGFSRSEGPVDRNTIERAAERANLVSFPGGGGSLRMVVFTPADFDQVQTMADHLKNRRPVLLNLEGVDKELAQRILNFLSGTIYALSGEMHRVAANVLLFAPGNVEIIHEVPIEGPQF